MIEHSRVETMAYTNQVPWHGLGFRITNPKSIKTILKDAKLDWTVDRRPLAFGDVLPDGSASFTLPVDKQRVPDFAALVRDRDNKVLDIVGSRYQPVQNDQVFEFLREFVEAGKGTLETAGSLRGGKLVWALIKLNASFKLKGDDVINGYLLVVSPHQQGKSLIIKFTTIRVVCNNTLVLALRDGKTEFRMTHRSLFDNEMMAKAKDVLGIAREQLGVFEENARKLQSIKIDPIRAIKILAPIYQPNVEVADLLKAYKEEGLDGVSPRMRELLTINEKAPGARPENGWGLLNAATYYSDHVASRTPDKRLTNAWLGRTAQQKEKVLVSLLENA